MEHTRHLTKNPSRVKVNPIYFPVSDRHANAQPPLIFFARNATVLWVSLITECLRLQAQRLFVSFIQPPEKYWPKPTNAIHPFSLFPRPPVAINFRRALDTQPIHPAQLRPPVPRWVALAMVAAIPRFPFRFAFVCSNRTGLRWVVSTAPSDIGGYPPQWGKPHELMPSTKSTCADHPPKSWANIERVNIRHGLWVIYVFTPQEPSRR